MEYPDRGLDDVHAEYLETLQKMDRAGAHIAVPAALEYCVRCRVNVPAWVNKRALELFCELLNPVKSKKQGRSAGMIERYRQDSIDHIRFEVIEDLRRQRTLCDEQIQELSMMDGTRAKKMLAELHAKRRWLGITDKRLFEIAEETLRGAAGGSYDAMKKAYKRFADRSAQPDRYRYHVLDPRFLRSIGAYVPPWIRKGNNSSR